VRIEGLGKDFRHPWTRRVKTAVHSISLEVPEGGVFGLLGPNGAGKTTTLRMLLGLLPPTRGEAFLLGRPAGTPESREDVGFLPENPYFYDHLTALEFLEFSGELAGMSRAAARTQAAELVEVASSTRRRRACASTRRACCSATGPPAPPFLDEPMSGLDPIGRREVVDLIRELKARDDGRVLEPHPPRRRGAVRSRRHPAPGAARVGHDGRAARGTAPARRSCSSRRPARAAASSSASDRALRGRTRLTMADATRASALVAWLASHGHEVIALTPERRSPEDLFMEMFQGAHEVGGDPERRERREADRRVQG
jgi:ABC-type Na+ transport system ATPase subunit NatA